MADGQFIFRLSATGGEELNRTLRAAGDAGENMAARIASSAQKLSPALLENERRIDGIRAAMERTQAVAARGWFNSPELQRNLQQAGFQITDFITQVQAGGNVFVAFAQQGSQLAASVAGGLAGLAVTVGAIAAQYLLASRNSDAATESAISYTEAQARARSAIEGVNQALETQAQRLRRTTIEQRQALAGQLEAARVDFERRDAALAAERAESERIANQSFRRQTSPEQIAALRAAQAQNIAEIEAQRSVLRQQLEAISEAERRLFNAPLPPGTEPPARESRIASGEVERVLARLRAEQEQITRAAEQLAAANRTADEVYQDQIRTINELVPRLESLYGVERANEIAARASVAAYEQRSRALERGAENGANAARELGLTFESAFENAIIRGQKLSQVLQGLASDIARIIARKTITEPLGGAISSLLQPITSSIGGFFNNLFGGSGAPSATGGSPNAFAAGGVMTARGPLPLRRYAAGGVARDPQIALFGEGAMAEAYVPLPDGRRIPVAMRGASPAPAITIVNNNDFRGADPNSEARILAAIRAQGQRTKAEVFDAIRRGGSARQIVRGA